VDCWADVDGAGAGGIEGAGALADDGAGGRGADAFAEDGACVGRAGDEGDCACDDVGDACDEVAGACGEAAGACEAVDGGRTGAGWRAVVRATGFCAGGASRKMTAVRPTNPIAIAAAAYPSIVVSGDFRTDALRGGASVARTESVRALRP
jgi:hypothetical protein